MRSRSGGRPLFLKERIECRFRSLQLARVLGDKSLVFRLEVIAEVSLHLLADFLSRRLTAMLRVAGVVLDAHFADVQFRIAGFANIQTSQRKAQRG